MGVPDILSSHHPLLAFGAPAYVLFVLSVRPRILLDWRQLVKVGLSILLGLSVFLYLPLRAGATSFGPTPNLDALAENGLLYNNIHSTALCSPTQTTTAHAL